MNDLLVLPLPGNQSLANTLAQQLDAETGVLEVHRFPDGESRVRIGTAVVGRTVVLACSLEHADAKLLPLLFAACAAREQGASHVVLVAPYLAYMRQDYAFREGEGVSARYFAELLSSFVDGFVTVDPHLHRIHSLHEIYRVPAVAVQAAPAISGWIRDSVKKPLLVGPDAESRQWVAEVARNANAPCIVLAKRRHGDRDVEVTLPALDQWRGHTPVLVDDMVSTAQTMIRAVSGLRAAGMTAPVCIAVHALFSGAAHDELAASGAARIVSCNTVPHASNAIDVIPDVACATRNLTIALAVGERPVSASPTA
jgi:ribose-phosphate pyrophosphokinase